MYSLKQKENRKSTAGGAVTGRAPGSQWSAPGTAHLNVRWAHPPWSPAALSLQGHAERVARSGLTLWHWGSGTGQEPRGRLGTQPGGCRPKRKDLSHRKRNIGEVTERVQSGDGNLL